MQIYYVVLSLFAVFGFCCAVRIFAERIWTPEQLVVAIEILDLEDAEMLDMLLHEAVSAFSRRRGTRVVILLSACLMDGRVGEGEELLPEYRELIDRYGADCYLIH
ncbi:MAG: hypothetical protein E7666_08710 [Ruminococcaceae bacterium]|nr:hypothetical protein [Oscillospiraceae bacterium]